jgi:hypothetical protein
MANEAVVVLVTDTTEIELTRPHEQVTGAGPLDNGARRGLLLHPLHGFTPDGTPLGTVYAQIWTREEAAVPPATKPHRQYKRTPIEQKESYRWVETLRQAQQEAALAEQTRFVTVADSEADIYEVFVEAQTAPQQVAWIVRACQNRALVASTSAEQTACAQAQAYVREQLMQQPVLFTQTITVRAQQVKVSCDDRKRRRTRQSRRAEVEVRAATVRLRPPWRSDRQLPEISLNAVMVSQVPADQPQSSDEDQPPVEWILLTSLPIDTAEAVRQVIKYYCVRWMIEVFFRTLKSGCRIEQRRFETIERLERCLAVYLIITWRTLYVCRLSRSSPAITAEAVFEPAEWKSLWYVVHRQAPPTQPPTLSEMVLMLAKLGGYVNRHHDAHPGPETVWRGLERLNDIAHCWQLFGPEASPPVLV